MTFIFKVPRFLQIYECIIHHFSRFVNTPDVDNSAALAYHTDIEKRENTMENSQDFTSGRILSPLLKFAVPLFAALFLQAMYGAVDLAVVGSFAKTADISAVATGSQIMQTVTGIFTGLATGITVLIGQMIGKGERRTAGRTIGAGIALFAIVAAVGTAVFTLCASPISVLMQAPKEAFSQTVPTSGYALRERYSSSRSTCSEAFSAA